MLGPRRQRPLCLRRLFFHVPAGHASRHGEAQIVVVCLFRVRQLGHGHRQLGAGRARGARLVRDELQQRRPDAVYEHQLIRSYMFLSCSVLALPLSRQFFNSYRQSLAARIGFCLSLDSHYILLLALSFCFSLVDPPPDFFPACDMGQTAGAASLTAVARAFVVAIALIAAAAIHTIV